MLHTLILYRTETGTNLQHHELPIPLRAPRSTLENRNGCLPGQANVPTAAAAIVGATAGKRPFFSSCLLLQGDAEVDIMGTPFGDGLMPHVQSKAVTECGNRHRSLKKCLMLV